MYLPTASLQLLETLAHALPNHQLIVADFDALPDVQLPGTNAPLVAATVGYRLRLLGLASYLGWSQGSG